MQKLVPCPLPTSSSRFWILFALFCTLLFREMYFFVGIYFVISQFWPFRECECDSIRNPYRCNWATDLSTVKQTLEKGSWKQYTCKKKTEKWREKNLKFYLPQSLTFITSAVAQHATTRKRTVLIIFSISFKVMQSYSSYIYLQIIVWRRK